MPSSTRNDSTVSPDPAPDNLILFIGDSITDAGRDRSDPTSLGNGYVSRVASRLQHATVANRGIGGDRITDLHARWHDDCLRLRPSVLSVLIGVNDTWRRFESGQATSTADFESFYREILEQAVTGFAPRLVLMEPFLVPVRDEQESWLEDLDEKRAVVRRLADDFAAKLVRTADLFRHAMLTTPAAELTNDGVHPTPLGHEMIATAWLDAAPHTAVRLEH